MISFVKTTHYQFRAMLVLAAFFATIVPLAAGGSSETAGAIEEPVELTVMYWDNLWTDLIEEAIARFEAQYPNVTVEASAQPWSAYWDRLQITTRSQDPPDVFWINVPNFPEYSDAGALADISSVVSETGRSMGDFPVALTDRYSRDGRLYAIPANYDTVALAFNKDVFDEAGVPYPDASWDWDRLREVAEQLTVVENGVTQRYGFGAVRFGQHGYYNFMAANGGGMISRDGRPLVNSPESVEAVQFLVDMMEDGIAPPGAEIIENEIAELFYSGRVAMLTVGSWEVARIADAMGDSADFAPIPASPRTGERKSIIHGIGWGVSSFSRNQEMAMELLSEFVSDQFYENLASSGVSIPGAIGLEEAWVSAIPQMDLTVFTDAVEYAHPYPVSRDVMDWMSVEWDVFTDIWLGNTPVNEGLRQVEDAMVRTLGN